MRSLKFRAWVNDHWTDFIPTCKTLDAYNAFIIDTDGYTFDKNNPLIVEQYTGLKDKNGKEIYEGDIVVGDNNTRTYVVKFGKHNIDCCGCCYTSHQSVGFYLAETNRKEETVYADDDEWEKLEVVGNIHEKQESLGE